MKEIFESVVIASESATGEAKIPLSPAGLKLTQEQRNDKSKNKGGVAGSLFYAFFHGDIVGGDAFKAVVHLSFARKA